MGKTNKNVSWSSLLGKFQINIWKFSKGELPFCHIFHGFYSVILKYKYKILKLKNN